VALGEWSGTEKDWKTFQDKDMHGSKLEAKPNGTGAYMFVSKSANQSVYKAFDGYWGGKPKIENVIFQIVPEVASRLEALKRGDADMAETGGRSTLPQIQDAPGVKIFDGIENNGATAIFMNQNIKNAAALGSGKLDGKGIPATFFADMNVRKAFAYSFDYDRYIKEVQVGKGKKRGMLLPESFPGYDPKVKTYAYNPELAKAFFQKAYGGQVWQNGFVLVARYRANSVTSQTALEILKANVEKVNPKFKVDLQPQPWPELLADAKKGATAMILITWVPDYADPDNFLYTFYHSQGFYAPRSAIHDSTLDKYLEQARVTTDTAKRNALYSLVGQRAYDQAYFINVPAGIDFVAYRDNLKGVEDQYNIMLSGGFYWKDLSK
jgi:peptide/nickel transport system substrate-binding protein